MARYPSRAPRALIKPDYKTLMGLGGGLNLSVPPDQLPDIDSPDLLNLTFHMRQLEVAGGIAPLGTTAFVGIPQRVFQWETSNHFTWHILVTTRRVYTWDVTAGPTGTGDWVIVDMASDMGVPGTTLTSDGTLPVVGAADNFRDWFMMTNGFDKPFYFDGVSIHVIPDLVGIVTTARYIARYHQVTVVANTTEGGVEYPYRIRRSQTGNSAVWTPATSGGPAGSDAGFDDLLDKDDDIHWLDTVNPYLIVYRRTSVIRALYVGQGYSVFYYDYGVFSTGPLSTGATATNKLYSTIIALSGIYQYAGDYTLTDIGDKVFNFLLNRSGNLEFTARSAMFTFYVPETDETWIAYPSNGNSNANRVLKFNHKTNSWWLREFVAQRFLGWGFFAAPGPSGSPPIPPPANEDSQKFNTILLCGMDGKVYQYGSEVSTTDNGVAIPWHFTTKDFVIPDNWETVDGIVFYGQGVIDLVELSHDAGITWQTWGTNVNMNSHWSRAEVDGQITTSMIRVRISGVDPSFTLSWMAIKHMVSSER